MSATIIPPTTLTRPHPGRHPGHTLSDPSESPELAEEFRDFHAGVIKPRGIQYPMAMAMRTDGRRLYMTMVDEPEALRLETFRAIHQWLGNPEIEELVFGMDRAGGAPEFLGRQRFLSVHHYRREHGWRFGVLEYDAEARVMDRIAWEHAYWTQRLNAETLEMFRDLMKEGA